MGKKVEDIEVAGYKIRPWTVSLRMSLVPEFREINRVMAAEGIEPDDIPHQGPEISNLFLPAAISIVAKSLAITVEEVDRLPFSTFREILGAVIRINHLDENEDWRLQ